MLFVNFLKKNAEAGQAFFKKLLLVLFISQSRRDRYRQCLCLEQSKIHQTSSGYGICMFLKGFMKIFFHYVLMMYVKPYELT